MYNSNKPNILTPQLNPINPPVNLLDFYEEGNARAKLRKIELRKDAVILLHLKQRYEAVSKHFAKFRTNQGKHKIPFIALNSGQNLLLKHPDKMGEYSEIYNISLEELASCNIAFFSLLPNLLTLSIRFSNILLMSEDEYLSKPRYPSLIELNLKCNNLDSSCFNIIRHMKQLKRLNLMGNFIRPEICDVSTLVSLEEIDLSYNHLESYYINLNKLKDLKFNGDLIALNENINSYNDHETNDKHVDETQKTIQQLQTYLKTNMQDFYHKIAMLPRLKVLNLSHNKIHFFDIDPIIIGKINGFACLEEIDLSDNVIEEELSILMVINVPNLKKLDITNNPIVNNKKSYDTIEYEIYKSKDILLTNNTVKQKKRFKYNVKDILNDPPQPYIVKKFPLDIKSKKELMVTVKPLIIEESKNKDNDNDNDDEDAKNANSDDNNNNVVLPPLGQLSVNPILMTRLDMVGKRKMNYNSNKK